MRGRREREGWMQVEPVKKICSHTKIQDDFDLIKFITFEVTQFHSTPLSDLKLVSGMLTQDTALLLYSLIFLFLFFLLF